MNRLLARIEFSFLEEQKNAKGWDNTFYDLFLLFSAKEFKFEDLNNNINDRMLLMISDTIYVKEYQQKCIQVYSLKKKRSQKDFDFFHQFYLFFIYKTEEIPIIKEVIEEVKKYLDESGRIYKIIKKEKGNFFSFSKAIFYIGLELID